MSLAGYQGSRPRRYRSVELADSRPSGLRYAAFKLDDGVSFVHIASTETADGRSPLPDVGAFRRFREGIAARCDEQPVVVERAEIGSFRAFEESPTR